MAEPVKTDIDPAVVARTAQGVSRDGGIVSRITGSISRFFIRNAGPERIFSPGQPLLPQQQDDLIGRQFDFPIGYNMRTVPRGEELTTFSQLRGLADSYDLVRLLIETRKDQVCRIEWNITPREEGADPDARCKAIQDFLQYPNQTDDWATWLRMILEEMLVIDATTIYPVKTNGGKLYALDIIDGATIRPLIDYYGRSPAAPDPAYQQIIKGLPSVDYSRDMLIYAPRNKRAHKVYGYSQIEQIIATVNIALRRQLFQLQYYTEGNVPEAIFGVPETWTPDNIKNFQMWWDALLEGNTGARRHAKFVPGGMQIHETRPNGLKDEMDDWLARICCYAFSIAPGGFVKDQNRATAQTSKDSSDEEGLAPTKQWVKSLMDKIIAIQFGAPDLQFAWHQEIEIDQLKQAQIDDIYIKNGTYSAAYVAERMGLEAIELSEEMPDDQAPTNEDETPSESESATSESANSASDSEKLAKSDAKKKVQPIKHERQQIQIQRKKLNGIVTEFLQSQASPISRQVIERMKKADDIADQIDLSGWAVLIGDVQPVLEKIALEGVRAAAIQLSIASDDRIVSLANQKAIEYAKNRSATLVGMRYLPDGSLVPNMNPTIHGPEPQWAITDSTRNMIRSVVTQAEMDGWSNDRLAKAIMENDAFSKSRALMIARTETAFADVQGNVALWRESGQIKHKEWLTAHDDKVSPDCVLNGKAAPVPLESAFPSGEYWPPDHPRCRCSVIPVFED